MAGVKVDEEAHVICAKNLILKNIEQGILIVEKSSAHIENNIIKENVKANIAFGGENSCNTAIIRNKIMGSRCEGIFMVESGKSFIHNNEIHDNYDGIICLTSFSEISYNKIFGNRCNGIMILKDSQPNITNNTITDNAGIGIVVRDKSKGSMTKNVLSGNELDIFIERKKEEMSTLKVDNKISGEVRMSQRGGCIFF